MKIKHRPYAPPPQPEGDPVPVAYEKQVQQATAKLERRYRNAQRGLERAQAKRATVARGGGSDRKRVLRRLDAEIEARREELLYLQRQMTSHPGDGVYHRGTGQAKPWAQGGAL